jgi:hypothetical protein
MLTPLLAVTTMGALSTTTLFLGYQVLFMLKGGKFRLWGIASFVGLVLCTAFLFSRGPMSGFRYWALCMSSRASLF